MQLSAAQIQYIRDVLGVNELLRAKTSADAEAEGQGDIERQHQPSNDSGCWLNHPGNSGVAVLQVSDGRPASSQHWDKEQFELLTKILAALQFDVETVEQWEWVGSKPNPDFNWSLRDGIHTLIVFGQSSMAQIETQISNKTNVNLPSMQFGQILEAGDLKVICTYSLDEMIKAPNLKKSAWQHLRGLLN